jgi:hypothetical protein
LIQHLHGDALSLRFASGIVRAEKLGILRRSHGVAAVRANIHCLGGHTPPAEERRDFVRHVRFTPRRQPDHNNKEVPLLELHSVVCCAAIGLNSAAPVMLGAARDSSGRSLLYRATSV